MIRTIPHYIIRSTGINGIFISGPGAAGNASHDIPRNGLIDDIINTVTTVRIEAPIQIVFDSFLPDGLDQQIPPPTESSPG